MENKFQAIAVVYILGVVASFAEGSEHIDPAKKTASFEDLVSSLTNSSATQLEESFNRDWDKSEGDSLSISMGKMTPGVVGHFSLAPKEAHGDGSDSIPLIYPGFIASFHQVDQETSQGESFHPDATHQLIPSPLYEKDLPEDTYGDLLFYLPSTEMSYADNAPTYLEVPGEDGGAPHPLPSSSHDAVSKGKRPTIIHPLQVLTRNLFGRPVDPKTFLKWSSETLMKAIYPYYHKPRHRYPYYDKEGNGELVYGYGTNALFRYHVFRPLQGYLR